MLSNPIEDFCTDGKLDGGKIRDALREYEGAIQLEDDEDNGTLAVLIQYLHELYHVTRNITEDPENDARLFAEKKVDKSLEHKMNRNRFGLVRTDIRRVGGVVRVRLSYANPAGFVGTIERGCREYAVYCARILRYMQQEFAKNNVRLNLEGVGDAVDIFDEAEFADARQLQKDAVTYANENRKTCLRRHTNICSPVRTECRCYVAGGYCAAAELPKEWEKYPGMGNWKK